MLNAMENYFSELKSVIDNLDRNEIETFINVMLNARNNGKNIYIMGNGGSGATASHFCCDFNKGMSYTKDKKFKMICLNDNVSTMLAYSNDVGYDFVFVEQLKNFVKEGDIVIGISGSGNSKNVLNAIDYANKKGAITIGLTGYNGGVLKQITKYSVNANVDNMQITEDIHMMICHMIYDILINQDIENKKELICG